jgi:hypothetical protein
MLRRHSLLIDVTEKTIEGKIERTERRGKRRKQLLHDLKKKRRYWKLKEKAADRTIWKTRFGKTMHLDNTKMNLKDV